MSPEPVNQPREVLAEALRDKVYALPRHDDRAGMPLSGLGMWLHLQDVVAMVEEFERGYTIVASDPALIRELDHCTPRYEGGSPNPTNGGATAFSGWYVPDWLMQRIRAALGSTR